VKLTVLGSGTPVINKNRKAASYLLEVGGKLLLFDCGWGVINLPQIGCDVQTIDHIFITHPHADHIGNLMNLLQSMFVSGLYFSSTLRHKPLYLHGYPGFMQDFADLRRIMFQSKPQFEIMIDEYGDTTASIADCTISSKVVPHSAHFSSVCYRLQHDDQVFMYGGDSCYHESLIQLAREADIAIIEAAISREEFERLGPRPNHLSAREAGQIAKLAQVKKLVLVHNYDVNSEEEVKLEAQKNFSGEIIVARDLQVINT
jgi:ribonuclease BN (tRNA processing enzyme)